MNICVIGGAGYVGLVTGAALADMGHIVNCVDINSQAIERLQRGIVGYEEELRQLVEKGIRQERLIFTAELSQAVADSKIIFICVGTPETSTGEADVSYLMKAAQDVASLIRSYKLIVVKSTVPADSLEVVRSILQRGSKGIEFDLAVVPEFLREGSGVYDFLNPERVVIGVENERAAQCLNELFCPLSAPLIRTTLKNAIMIKYASNAYLTTRISFINEIANICEVVGADIGEVCRGMAYDKRIGHDYLSPGIGYGGPCLSKDLNAFINTASSHGYTPHFLKAVQNKNEHQINYIVAKVRNRVGGSLENNTIAVLGLSFKPNTTDLRGSLSLRVINLLQNGGARVRAYDPQAMDEAKKYLHSATLCSSLYEAVRNSDLLLTLTAWEEFKSLDWQQIRQIMKSPFIIDGVNTLDSDKMKSLGFSYVGIGRKA